MVKLEACLCPAEDVADYGLVPGVRYVCIISCLTLVLNLPRERPGVVKTSVILINYGSLKVCGHLLYFL